MKLCLHYVEVTVFSCLFISVYTSVFVCSCLKGNSSTVRALMWVTSPIKPSAWKQDIAGFDGNTTLTTWDRFVTNSLSLTHTPRTYSCSYKYWLIAGWWFVCVSLPQALMSLFVLSCKDGWVSIMYDGLDAVGVDQQVKTHTHSHTHRGKEWVWVVKNEYQEDIQTVHAVYIVFVFWFYFVSDSGTIWSCLFQAERGNISGETRSVRKEKRQMDK